MNDTTRPPYRLEEICDAARLLPASERLALAEAMLQSLETADPDLDRQWAAEAQDRLEAYTRGEMEAYDLEEILAKYDRK